MEETTFVVKHYVSTQCRIDSTLSVNAERLLRSLNGYIINTRMYLPLTADLFVDIMTKSFPDLKHENGVFRGIDIISNDGWTQLVKVDDITVGDDAQRHYSQGSLNRVKFLEKRRTHRPKDTPKIMLEESRPSFEHISDPKQSLEAYKRWYGRYLARALTLRKIHQFSGEMMELSDRLVDELERLNVEIKYFESTKAKQRTM